MQLMDRDIEESIRFIQAAVGRLARIIDALLRLSRAGRVEYQWQEVDLAATVGKIVDALHDTIAAKGAQVAVGELPPAWGDPTALEQVFANLIGNAVQYLDPDRPGRIEVDGAEPDGTAPRACGSTASATMAWASPRPTTIGCSPPSAASMPASPRARGSAWPWCGGWSSGTAAGSGWSPRRASAPPSSSPCPRPPAGPRPAPAATARPAGRRRRARPPLTLTRTPRRSQPMGTEPLLIVLAEDDDGHASLVQRNLERAGLANGLERLKDGQEALDFVRGEGAYAGRNPSQQPVLLLLDIKMPRVDGVEVLRQIKADPRTALIPVIMLTTTDDPREIQRCYELGCSVYITKPVDYQGFVEAIKRLGLFLQVVRVPSTSQWSLVIGQWTGDRCTERAGRPVAGSVATRRPDADH